MTNINLIIDELAHWKFKEIPSYRLIFAHDNDNDNNDDGDDDDDDDDEDDIVYWFSATSTKICSSRSMISLSNIAS